MTSKLTSIADEKIEDVIKMARESAKIYGGEWDSALIAESPGNNVHGITSDHIEAVVVRTDDDSLHSSWLCDYLESVSPAFVIAALTELQERRKAAMDSKPVAWLLSGGGAKNVVSFDSGNAYADPLREVTPLYRHAQPAAVVPDEMTTELAWSNMGISGEYSEPWSMGWNACRAAFRENANSSTESFREIPETSTNSLVIPDQSIPVSDRMTVEDTNYRGFWRVTVWTCLICVIFFWLPAISVAIYYISSGN